MMKLKMKNNYILIKELDEDEITKGGIIIPKMGSRNRKAIVIESGDCDQVQNDDIIIKNLGKGTRMTLDGQDYEMIHINHIMAIIKTK